MREVGADLERQRNKLGVIQGGMQGSTVRAPAAGMVIYQKEWNGQKLTAGSQISAWDPTVATLPDLTHMESVTYVNEVDVHKVAPGQPVMWVNTRTLLAGGPWASANERAWDKTLVRALSKYPNMRIFNWSAVAQPGWFLSDGIHYDTLGCAMRASAIAQALARAFPLNGHSKGQIVS